MGRLSRSYVFKVTVIYDGIAPKPDAHQLRQCLMASLLDAKFPARDPGRFRGGNSVALQVRCAGGDRRGLKTKRGRHAAKNSSCAGWGSYCGHSKSQHNGGKGGCRWSQGEQFCWCKRYVPS